MVIGLIIGILLGIILSLTLVFYISPSIMFKENKSKHDFETTLAELEKTVASKGWVIPNVNDLQAALKKFEYDVHKVKVYEICKPELGTRMMNVLFHH